MLFSLSYHDILLVSHILCTITAIGQDQEPKQLLENGMRSYRLFSFIFQSSLHHYRAFYRIRE